MQLRERVAGSWQTQAILVLLLSAIIAGLGAQYTRFSFLQIMILADIVGGIIISIYQINDGDTQSQSTDDAEVPAEAGTSGSAEDTTKTPPSDGLTAEQRQIQNEIIRRAYDRFDDNPYGAIFHRSSFIDEISNELDVSEESVQKVWKITRDDGFFKKRGSSIHITQLGLDRAEALGEDLLIDDAIQDDILDILDEEYREDPHRPKITRDQLIEAMDCSSDAVDHNVWLLDEKGYIEKQTYMGDSRGYQSVQITNLGRRVLE
jgi:Mn-dependent DtxR family transcriptional regulator